MNKFTKTIMSLLINLTADKNDLQLLKVAFKEIDKDNDGVINMEEFKKYQAEMAEFGIEDEDKWGHILAAINTSKKKQIGYMEFITAAIDHRKYMTKQNMEKAFNLLDSDKDGHIDASEFIHALPLPSD